MTDDSAGLGWIEKLLALWIFFCIVIGLALRKYFPEFSQNLGIGIPIGLFLMIYPAMTKIELHELKEAFKNKKQVGIIV
jgi:ACR3 family arsenite transporter